MEIHSLIGWRSAIVFIIFGASTIFSTPLCADELRVFTEYDAYDLLTTKSLRWKQANEGVNEANAKLTQAKSLLLPHFNFGVDEFVGRINLLQYGFSDPGDLSVFTFGSTTISFAYNL